MIAPIDHNQLLISSKIYAVFQRSYAVEAAILECDDFPPLKRTIAAIQDSNTQFYGYYDQSELKAVMELEEAEDHVHIRSLTVDPPFFRQGIGFKLLGFVTQKFRKQRITVETGNENQPAVDFYIKFGFKKDRVWMTAFGIEKASFTLQKSR